MSTNTLVSKKCEGIPLSFAQEHEEEGPGDNEEEGHEEYSLPDTPRDFVGLVCECKNLNWSDPLNNGGICDYTYIDGSLHYQMKPHPTLGLPCQDKVNLRQVPLEECDKVCKYQLMSPTCCDLPEDVRDDLVTFLSWGGGGDEYDERLDSSHPNHYKKHYSSLKEMFDARIEESQKAIDMCENMDFSNLNGEYIMAYGWTIFWDKDSNRLWDAETSLCCIGIMSEDENGQYIPDISEWAEETRKSNPETNARLGLPK
jgi:hypothetical protein